MLYVKFSLLKFISNVHVSNHKIVHTYMSVREDQSVWNGNFCTDLIFRCHVKFFEKIYSGSYGYDEFRVCQISFKNHNKQTKKNVIRSNVYLLSMCLTLKSFAVYNNLKWNNMVWVYVFGLKVGGFGCTTLHNTMYYNI